MEPRFRRTVSAKLLKLLEPDSKDEAPKSKKFSGGSDKRKRRIDAIRKLGRSMSDRLIACPTPPGDDTPAASQSPDCSSLSPQEGARLSAKKKYFAEKTPNKNIFSRFLHPTFHQRSIQFRKIFSGTVPDDDRLLYSFSCAFQREILAQGRMFISQQNVCFYANIFSWETLFAIPIKEIALITKEKAAYIFPNSIRIETKGERFFFASFINREKTFTVLDTVKRSVQEDKPISPEELWELMNPEEEEQKFPSECPCESHFGRLIMDRTFEFPVDELYTLLFTDTPWFRRYNEQMKNTGYAASDWMADKENGRQRTVTYTVALNHAMAPKSCTVTETQVCAHLASDGFVVRKESHNAGVPYADSFAVLVTYCVTKVSPTTSRFRIHGGIDYRKSIWGMIKTMIDKNTNQGLDDHYAAMEHALDEELERRDHVEDEIGEEATTSDLIPRIIEPEGNNTLHPIHRRDRTPMFPRSISVAASRVNYFDEEDDVSEVIPKNDRTAKIVVVLLACILFVNIISCWFQFRAGTPGQDATAQVSLESLSQMVKQISDELQLLKAKRTEL
ncbi:unnamed protein product, partial [Mesorhabditis spiculigera]